MPPDHDSADPKRSRPTLGSATDPIEQWMIDCLQAPEDEQPAILTDLCARHPEQAEALRRRFDLLRGMGLSVAAPVRDEGQVPERLGDFQLLERLGAGGMGVVHRARQVSLQREVAVKLIRPERLWFPGSRAMFQREVQAVARMQHPGIVPIYVVGEEQGIPFYAMELVPGRSLAAALEASRTTAASELTGDRLLANGPPGFVDAGCEIARQVAMALAHAHARGVVHRDVKPSNVMLAPDGRALLLDFGLASPSGGERLTRTGSQHGSLAYMSPEQVRGERVDARTDVYSLGVTLYELLTLSPAFAGATEAAIRNRIERGEVVPLAAARRGIPWDVATVCATAMAPEREQRYQTAADLAADLQAVLERRPIAARSPGPGLRLRRFVQRRPTLATALLLGALLVVGAPSALLIQEQRARGRIEQEAIRAANAERDAVRDAATARRVVQFLREVFQQGSPDEDRGRNLTARELLDRGLRRISAELSDEPAAHAELLDAMAGAYLGLRATALAIELYEQSLALQRQLGWSGVALHRTLCGLGAARHAHEDYVGAEELLRTVLRELPPLSDPDGLAAVAPSLQLAAVLKPQGRIAEALQRCDDVIAALQRPGAPERQLADALQKRGALRRESGAEEAGDGDQQQALAILRRCLPPDHPEFVDALCDLGLNAYGRRDPAQAEPLLVEAEALADRVFPAGHPKLAQVRDYLGLLRSAQGRIDEAQLLLDRSEASFRQSQPPPSLAFARHLTHRSKVALSGNDKPRAIAAAQEACAMFRSLLPDGSLNECVALDQVTLALGMAGRAAEALPYARRGFELRGRLEGAAHQQGLTAAALARVAEAAGERDLAAAAADAALAQLATLPDTVLADLRFSWLGIWLMNQKRHDDAARVLDRHLAALRATGTLRTGTGADALVKAGVLRHFLRRPAESLPLLQEGYALAREANEPQVRQEAADWLGFLLAKAGRAQEALPYAEEALALVRQTGPPAAIHSAAVTLAFVQRDLGDREAATALLWPVVDELVAKGQQGGQAPRVLGLLFELLPDGDQRDAARQRLRAAARVLLPADHALRQRLEAGG